MITAEKWYQQSPDNKYFYQGDVIRDVPYPFWPTLKAANEETKIGILRPLMQEGRPIKDILKSLPTNIVGRAARDVPDAWKDPAGEYVVAGCRKMNVMIITRSCSLDNPSRKHFTVAPVQAIADLPLVQQGDEKLKDLRQNNIPHNFFLPAKDGLGESYAEFLKLALIHRSFFDLSEIHKQLVARLSSSATAELQNMLSDHFGTKFGFDFEDECPQTAMYSCSNCFHSGMHVKLRMFPAEKPFGPCEGCGEDAMWVKIPS